MRLIRSDMDCCDSFCRFSLGYGRSSCVRHQGELAVRKDSDRRRHQKYLVISFESKCPACPEA